ncbi:MAG: hypothetical protein KKF56_00460 [Nanoarchaeota archaeon]|nr:hypothetical protein [Nanoarchaeota archaeon]
MNILKKWWFWLIIVIILLGAIFFYPKVCGDQWYNECDCFGISNPDPLRENTEPVTCYGVCMESSCEENSNLAAQKKMEDEIGELFGDS